MIEVLADMHIAEAEGNLGRIPRKAQDSISYLGYTEALKLHSLGVDEFETSFNWYSERPAVFHPMYETVLESIKSREQAMTEIRKASRGTAGQKKKKRPIDLNDTIKSEVVPRIMMKKNAPK